MTAGVENGETTLKADQLVRTFETVKKLEEYSNGMSYDDEAAAEAFKAGELAFIAAGPWNEPDYKNAGVNYDIQLIPSYDENGYTRRTSGLGLHVRREHRRRGQKRSDPRMAEEDGFL